MTAPLIITALLAISVAALLVFVLLQERKMSREAIIGNALKAKVKELTTANADLSGQVKDLASQLAAAQVNAKDAAD